MRAQTQISAYSWDQPLMCTGVLTRYVRIFRLFSQGDSNHNPASNLVMSAAYVHCKASWVPCTPILRNLAHQFNHIDASAHFSSCSLKALLATMSTWLCRISFLFTLSMHMSSCRNGMTYGSCRFMPFQLSSKQIKIRVSSWKSISSKHQSTKKAWAWSASLL